MRWGLGEAARHQPGRGGLVMVGMLLGQALVTVALAGALLIWQGQVAAVSALLGGLTALVPNAFLAGRLLRAGTGGGGKPLLRAAWVGEIGKLLLTVLLFAVIFARVRPLEPLAVFGGYIAAQAVIFGALLLGGSGDKRDTTKN